MLRAHSLRQKIGFLFRVLGPIFVTQVALSAMNVVDTMMSGRYGRDDLAGVAIGSNLWVPVFTGLSGVLLALTPIVSQLRGARQKSNIPNAVLQGIYLALLLAGIVIAIGAAMIRPVLNTMELEANVRHIAYHYLVGLAWGIVPLFVYTVLRSFIDALGQTRFTMAITLASLPINVIFNYALIFGVWGLPRLGGVGAGYASAITYWLIACIALCVVWRVSPFASYRIFARRVRVSLSAWKEQLRIGLPLGFSIFFEVSIFSAVALLMSRFGTVTLAAHQAAINFSGLVYMIPMSISLALTITVGFEVGANRPHGAMQYTYLGMATSLACAFTAATLLLAFRSQVAGFYTNDPAVLDLTRRFLFYVVFFQLSDAVAAPIQGALRGYTDVDAVLILSFVSYWVVGLPVGYFLANFSSLGPYGYWIGLIAGLAAGAIGLSLRLRYVQHMVPLR